ncbi:MAG: filamentous hemagglutinin N-terminal domain-containing protein [Methyloglobulus sp.]|nr:filamentous hemagglutinin N-terminal domain-containing protein [Methyloglobulus sp.]
MATKDKPQPHQTSGSLRLKPLSACIRAAIAGGVFLGHVSQGNAAPPVLPVASKHWVTSGSATRQILGNTMNIHQKSDKAILQWDTFNIGAKNQVQFQQPKTTSIALNKITDQNASQIFGKLNANGQVYLYNKNGFVFGKNSVVNTNTLVATALDIDNETFNTVGITKAGTKTGADGLPLPAFASGLEEAQVINPSILVEKGAKIHVGQTGRLIMAAPTVSNSGNLEADKYGQIMLIASKDKVYLTEPTNVTGANPAGLLVEIGTGGKVNNETMGNILARQGNVTLMGFAVNQKGRVSATTSAKVNGSVRLIAGEGRTTDATRAPLLSTTRAADLNDGLKTKSTVTFGSGSRTQIVADADDNKAVDKQAQKQSSLEVLAHTVHLQSGSAIGVPGGKVAITATNNPLDPLADPIDPVTYTPIPREGRIIMDSGAVIDVSGAKNISASVTRNIVEVPVQSYELRNSPLQKGGVLQGQTVQVDIRDKTPIVDTSGAVARVERGIDERLARLHSSVNLTAGGDVSVNPHARINISGGTVNYQGGVINTTKLVTDYGKIVDISAADPNEHYRSVLGVYKEAHQKWGVTNTWQTGGSSGQGHFEAGYREGLDAGTLNINTTALSWNGDLVAGAASGLFQRSPDTMAFGGELAIAGRDTNSRLVSQQNIVFQAQGNDTTITEDTPFPKRHIPDDPNTPAINEAEQPSDLVLSTDMIKRSGIQALTVKTQGDATIARDANITLASGKNLPILDSAGKQTGAKASEFNLLAANIDVKGHVNAAGGLISLVSGYDAELPDGSGLKAFNATAHLTLAPTAELNASGHWVNDFALGLAAIPTETTAINAGTVKLTSTNTLDLQSGSAIHADGGAWLAQNQQLTAGKAGAISIDRKNDLAAIQTADTFHLNGQLSAYGLTTGGTLSLTPLVSNLVVGTPDAGDINPNAGGINSDTLVLGVQKGRLDIPGIEGFSNIALTAQSKLDVKGQTTLNLSQQNRLLNDNFQHQASASSLAGFSTLATLPEYLRKPVDLSLKASDANGTIKLATGSKILGDKEANINLNVGELGSIYVDGLIDAPAGAINLTEDAIANNGYNPSPAIWLGRHGSLQARGTTRLNPPDALARRTGTVLDGGKVTLAANTGYVILEHGSTIDVSGTQATLDVLSDDPSGIRTVATKIGSNAGTIALAATEGAVFDGELTGASGSASTKGGRLDVRLDRSGRSMSQIGLTFGPLMLGVRQDYQRRLDESVRFGDNSNNLDLASLDLSGKAIISSTKISEGGFDDLRLSVVNQQYPTTTDIDSSMTFLGDVDLTVANRIDINAGTVAWQGLDNATQGKVNLQTAYLKVGKAAERSVDTVTFETLPPPVTGGGQFTAHTQWTEFFANSRWDSFNQLNFNSRHDIRAVGATTLLDTTIPTSTKYLGKLFTAANLNLTASQIYPSTLTDFTFAINKDQNPNGQITVANSGITDPSPLSAAGQLSFEAPVIHQNGTVKAPFGKLNFTASQALTLGKGSVTSVSGAGLLIPFGKIDAGQDWLYPVAGGGIVYNAPPEKKLVLSAPQIDLQKGSTVDLSGGGDLLAYEFQPGIGGSQDYLGADGSTIPDAEKDSPASFQGGFAVLPSLGSALAPFDPNQARLAGLDSYTGTYKADMAGNQVYLNGSDKLAAGFYTILPARYALLPGAFLVTPQAGSQDQRTTRYNAAGIPTVGGYQTLAGSNTRDARWSGFKIENGADIRRHSQYDERTANNFYAQHAVRTETAVPFLPKDSGQLVIKNVQTKLALNGDLKVAAFSGGRGTRVDIAAERLNIVKKRSATPTAGSLEVLASDLNALNAGSLLLGGERNSNLITGATDLSISTKTVTFDNGATVQGTDLIAAATQKVTVKKGAKLTASGAVNTGDESLNIVAKTQPKLDVYGTPVLDAYNNPVIEVVPGSSDGAFLRLSSDQQVQLSREAPLGPTPTGDLSIEAGATLTANKSMLLNASSSTTVAGDLQMKGGSLNLGANSVNLGEVGNLSSANALNLSNADLAKLTVDELILTGGNTINFYGNVGLRDAKSVLNPLTFNRLVLNTGGLSGFGTATQGAGIKADTMEIANTANFKATTQGTGHGQLTLTANSYRQGNGAFNINGFNSVAIAAAKDFTAAGNGSLNVDANLHLSAGYITSLGGKTLDINANGHQAVLDGPADAALPKGTEFGGTVNVTANTVNFNANALLPSGKLSLHSLTGDVLVGAQAKIDLAGRKVAFGDTFDYTSGGKLSAEAELGKITLAKGSTVDVSPGGGKAASGKLEFKAIKQQVELLGDLKAQGGSTTLDVAKFSPNNGFDSLMAALMTAGVSDTLSLRVRQADITQGAGNSISAKHIKLTADTGNVDIAGKLDANGADKGGDIKLYAGDQVILAKGAALTAKGTASTAEGGKVLLASTDADKDNNSGIAVNGGSLIDVSGGAQAQGGEVVLRALRTADNKGVAIKPIAGTVQGFSGFYADAVKQYGNADLGNDGTINAADISLLKADTDAYMTPATVQNVSRLGKGISLRPGLEINYTGDLALTDKWDFIDWRYGELGKELPGTLAITVSGDFTLQNSLTDGFRTETQTKSVDFNDGFNNITHLTNKTFNKDILQTNDSWSYQLTAGADLSSADKTAVTSLPKTIKLTAKPNAGQIDPLNQDLDLLTTVVRTGTGTIDLTASGDVVFDGGPMLDSTGLAIVDPAMVDAGNTALAQPFLFFNTAIYTAGKAETGHRYGAFSTVAVAAKYPGEFPLAGGDLAINAGHDIKGALTQDAFIRNTRSAFWQHNLLVRQGSLGDPVAGSLATPTAWGINFADFSQNVGGFGGGQVAITAGNNIDDLGVTMPTTGKQVGQLNNPDDPGQGFVKNAVQIDGGGELQVDAGGDIADGVYYLGQGKGKLNAEGAITGTRNSALNPNTGNTPWSIVDLSKGPQLLTGDTDLKLTANKGVAISAVSDPMILGETNLDPITRQVISGTNFFSYSTDSTISFKSLAGDIGLDSDASVIGGLAYTFNGGMPPSVAKVYPASLLATAFGGNVALGANSVATLFPSPKANVGILAKDAITGLVDASGYGKPAFTMSDADVALLPTALTPIQDVSDIANAVNLAIHAQTPLHRGDQTPVRIIAQQGNIENINFILPKKAIVTSGHDISNASFTVQHANLEGDVSVISAARDIRYSAERDPQTGNLLANTGSIQISGPGDVLVKSGRTIDLGTSSGISTIGNEPGPDGVVGNPNLPASGANITVLAGLNGAGPNYLGLEKLDANVLKYAENYAKYQALVTEFMRQRTGNTKLSTKTAFEQFNKLDPSQYATLQAQFNKLASTKYTDLISKMKQAMVQFVRQRVQNPRLTEAEALGIFAKLKPDETVAIQTQLNTYANEILFTELIQTGSVSAVDPLAGNQRGFDAIEALYPGNAWHGDLNLVFSTIQTKQDGNISLLVPGGNINVGLPVPGVSKAANELGVIASGKGAINAFLDKDFNVNQSRVFALGGDDINVWTSHGDIDAGRGTKSAFAVSDPVYSFDQNGNLIVAFPAPVAGSGIRTAAPLNKPNALAGNVGLFAPGGVVNASEAGIGGNNVTISATAVLGAGNIQVGGVGTGIPAASTVSLAAGLSGVSNLTANVSQMAEASADMSKDRDKNKKKQLGTISVELIGFGA